MAEITAQDVKNLREKTGAGMMDCKKALEKSNGDFAAAEKILKEQGLAAVEKRADRATNEGKVFAKVEGGKGVLVELACETDFVSRNDDFIKAGEQIVDLALSKGLKEPTDELKAIVSGVATKIKENMGLKRLTLLDSGSGIVTKYIHGDGAIGVLVALSSDKSEVLKDEKAKTLAFDLALHIAAFNPSFLDQSKVDQTFLKEQEEIFAKQLELDEKMKSKPENVRAGIVKGKLSKYLSEVCLLDQGFVKDEKLSVAKVLEETGKALGAKIAIADYRYFKVGQSA
jgi:elongation factor Ts